MKTQITSIERYSETPLGVIQCGFLCNGIDTSVEIKEYENGRSEIFIASGYQVEVISFKIRTPLYNSDTLTDGFGWVFRIEKHSDSNDNIRTYCLLDNRDNDVIFDVATGQNLDAIQVDDDEWTLHIGTEDGEMLNSRAEIDDWFPIRLKNRVDFYQSISEMKQNGFITTIPVMNKGEKIHIHYLVAYDRKDSQKINTWLAVEETKRNLENWIGIW